MKYFLLIISLTILSSCTMYGVSNDYKKLSEVEKTKIVPLENFTHLDASHIYKINGSQLKEELKKHPKSLVYLFSNSCKSDYCLPMSTYEQFAKENNYQLFLVMEGYGKLDQTTQQRSEVFTAPLFAINNDDYKSWYSVRYSRLFENELRGINPKEKPEWSGNLFFFNYDQLQKVTQELPK